MHTELPIWISKLCNLDKNAINSNALMCEIHRTMKNSKTKRGERKRAFLDMKFSVPVQTQSIVTETSTSAIFSKVVNEPVHNKDMKKTEENLSERRSKVKELTEKNKQLKRKYERMFGKQEAATMIKKKKDKELLESKSALKQLKKQLQNSEQKIKMYKNRRINISNHILKNARKCLSLKKKSNSNRAKVKIIEAKVEGNAKSESTVEALKREIREYNESIQYLQSLFEDTPYILLFNEDKKIQR